MIETKIIKALLTYGLSKNKAKVYISALKVGTGTVQKIAERANLARPTVHEIIKQLIEIGLINVNSKGKRNLYIARHPEKLENILQSYKRHLTNALPEFLSLFNESGHRPKIHFYEGQKSAKEVWDDTLKIKNKILKVISIADVEKVFSKDYFDHYVPRRINANIKLRSINPKMISFGKHWEANKKELREVHFTQPDFTPPISLLIYDDKIAICGSQTENFGLIIESDLIKKTFNTLFDFFWQITQVAKSND